MTSIVRHHHVTSTASGSPPPSPLSPEQLADLELRRRRARAEDRIRAVKDTRLANLPMYDFAFSQM